MRNKGGTVPGAEIVPISADRLRPNQYNPNRMTDDEFAELVAEVRHLKRLPKPVVVRPDGDGYMIVDGEHGWRAAKEAGLADVPCEVIGADDFEAMRQTYKRNQHGTHDPVMLGRMFRSMMAGRKLSANALAKEIAVSEGTVRNALLYAEAVEVRNGYEPDAQKRIAALTVRQARCYLKLGGRLADLWLDSGGDLSILQARRTAEMVENGAHWQDDCEVDRLVFIGKTGLFDFVKSARGVEGFREAAARVRKWFAWEQHWLRYGFDEGEFRGYSRHYFAGHKMVGHSMLMDFALEEIIDDEPDPPKFLLTAGEFASLLERGAKMGDIPMRWRDRLTDAVAEKTGKVRENTHNVGDRLRERKLAAAPEYIRASRLNAREKMALWEFEADDAARQKIAKLDRLPLQKREGWGDCIRRLVREDGRERELRAELEEKCEKELAGELAARFPLYDPKKDAAAIETLAGKLATLTREELLFLVEHCKGMEHMKKLAEAIRRS